MATTTNYATYPSLAGKVIVISGGANGIGACLVEHLALQGARVVFLDIAMDLATALIEKLASLRVAHKPVFQYCDLTNVSALKSVAATILVDHPKIHGLVNNAAGNPKAQRIPTLEVTPESWEFGINVNLRHQFFLTQALLPGLLAADGAASVINMGSITWIIPVTGLPVYTTCKAAVTGLTRTLAREFGPQGVRFNSIMPGSVATEAEKRDVLTPEYKAMVLSNQAIKRSVEPEDIARTALWLLSDDSSAITQQNIIVDGGWT